MASLPHLDVSGADGQAGADGTDHIGDSAPRGQQGRNGGNATAARPGLPGGVTEVTLQSNKDNPHLLLLQGKQGRVERPPQPPQSLHQTLPLTSAGLLRLSAHGGKGGDGGDGGRGQDGGKGAHGRDATKISAGTDGLPGGNGGSGGAATSGADGGKGGSVTVTVSSQDMHLLMLVQDPNVAGGRGGMQGKNGSGGSGGAGGDGGSRYSWTEEHARTKTVPLPNGSGGIMLTTVHYTETVHKSNPGGSSGPRGTSGSSGTATVTSGNSGQPGTFSYVVVGDKHGDGRTITKYGGRYEVKVTNFTFDSSNADGINEPGELVTISHIKVKNIGPMPTPPKQRIRFTLSHDSWLRPCSAPLWLPRPLLPNQETELPGELLFRVRPHQVEMEPAAPFESSGRLQVKAVMEVVERPFEGVGAFTEALRVRYPVQLSLIKGSDSLAAGTAVELSWTVSNVSDKPLGGEVRPMALHWRHTPTAEGAHGQLTADMLSFNGGAGQAWHRLSSPFVQRLPVIQPHQSLQMKGTLALSSDAPAYTQCSLQAMLALAPLSPPTTIKGLSTADFDAADQLSAAPQLLQGLQVVQLRSLTVCVSQAYVRNPASRLLLVASKTTTEEEYGAWRELARSLCTELEVWDVSLMGRLDFAEPINGSCLFEDLRGKLIILVDDEVQLSQGAAATPLKARVSDYLSREQLLQAMANSISFYFVLQPADSAEFARRWLVNAEPVDADDPQVQSYEKGSSLLKAADTFQGAAQRVVLQQRVVALRNSTSTHYMVYKVAKMQKELSEKHPDRRYIISYAHDMRTERKIHGVIECRRTIDRTQTHVVVKAETDLAHFHSPAVVNDRRNLYALLGALPFSEKLNRLLALSQPSHVPPSLALITSLQMAIWQDLAIEQRLLKADGCSPDAATLEGRMPKLSWLTRGAVFLDHPTFNGCWIRLLAGVRLYMDASTGFLSGLPGTTVSAVNDAVKKLIKAFFQRIPPPSPTKADLKTAQRALETQWQQERRDYNLKSGHKLSLNHFIVQIVFSHESAEQKDLLFGYTLLGAQKERIISEAERLPLTQIQSERRQLRLRLTVESLRLQTSVAAPQTLARAPTDAFGAISAAPALTPLPPPRPVSAVAVPFNFAPAQHTRSASDPPPYAAVDPYAAPVDDVPPPSYPPSQQEQPYFSRSDAAVASLRVADPWALARQQAVSDRVQEAQWQKRIEKQPSSFAWEPVAKPAYPPPNPVSPPPITVSPPVRTPQTPSLGRYIAVSATHVTLTP